MIQVSGNEKTLEELAKEHLNNLTNGENGFLSPKESLSEWINSGEIRFGRRRLVEKVYRNFDDIVLSPVKGLREFIQDLGEELDLEFSKKFQDVLRYKAFRRSTRAKRFVKNFGIKSCPYCNAQYMISLDKGGNLLCHFDHVFPKDKYPYLSVSFYNLIPCCSSCNQFKSDINPHLDSSYHHPFEVSLANSFRFRATALAIQNYRCNGRTKDSEENIDILVNDGYDIKFHTDTFKLKELYNEHNDVVDEIYFRVLAYNPEYLEQLKRFGLTEDEINRMYYGTYLDPKDINKRPLTKLNQDLLRQFFELQRR